MDTGEEKTFDQPEDTVAQVWEPESPFLSDSIPREGPPLSPSTAFGPQMEVESPFVSEYGLEGETVAGPQAEQFARLLGEMYDPEFEEALNDLANEATALAEDRLTREYGDLNRERSDIERTLREYLEPVERDAQAMYDRLIDAAGERDLSTMTATEIEALFERFEPYTGLPSPVFEEFLKKLWKKAKSAVKAVKSVVGKVMPLNFVLGKLKALVRPLLERVLKFALDKLPAPLRPAAQQLAKRFLGVSAEAEVLTETELDPVREAQTTADPAVIQEEMDVRFAGSILKGEDFDREVEIVQFSEVQTAETGDLSRELEEARNRFARDISGLQTGQDPTPVVENFVTAILSAARIAIRIIGRERVVKFLAGLVSKLISKYIGPEAANSLSRSLVDTGLRLMSLEITQEDEKLAAGYTIASTVEDTINRLVSDAPTEAWENEALLEAYTLEAFEKSASANFPDSEIKTDLHETAEKSGAWVLMPVKGTHKRYKKYTRVIEVKITPQMAQWIRSFGNIRLATILHDRYGVAPGSTITARLHLYEAIRGTKLSHIAHHEKNIAGLGNTGRSAWTLLHPLTPCAAGILFQEPGLGAEVKNRFLANRTNILVGQRFFLLEIPGITPRQLPRLPVRTGSGSTTSGKQSQTHLVLDFPRVQLRLLIYYSDADAQKLKGSLQNKSPGAIPALLTAGLDVNLRAIL